MSNETTSNFDEIIELEDTQYSRTMALLNRTAGNNMELLSSHMIMYCAYDDVIKILQVKLARTSETSVSLMWIATESGTVVNAQNENENFLAGDIIYTTTVDGTAYISKRIYMQQELSSMKVVLVKKSDDEYDMIFYNDVIDHSTEGSSYNITSDTEWRNDPNYNKVKSIVFDASFASAFPKSCKNWFKCETGKSNQALYITGLEHLNTSKCESLEGMFSGSKLVEIDVRNFIVTSVLSFDSMFANCKALKNIFGNNATPWAGATGYTSSDMFLNCESITKFRKDAITISKAYAGQGGYFTAVLTNQDDEED